ncbi:viral A-type inclusion protein [Reticulomyxa filosa]|uniref:Viral A-type inclusion protein n=1 Tax=Reticulomyxa filosa TaxID=46433 RepID=X6LVY7_RETFI|nr:viral A-type inclusion protein [Reticulomyxa filosa]|eukprot:ETO06108.1 viral A-type inclusion protein [Reticulomyxa filosa]
MSKQGYERHVGEGGKYTNQEICVIPDSPKFQCPYFKALPSSYKEMNYHMLNFTKINTIRKCMGADGTRILIQPKITAHDPLEYLKRDFTNVKWEDLMDNLERGEWEKIQGQCVKVDPSLAQMKQGVVVPRQRKDEGHDGLCTRVGTKRKKTSTPPTNLMSTKGKDVDAALSLSEQIASIDDCLKPPDSKRSRRENLQIILSNENLNCNETETYTTDSEMPKKVGKLQKANITIQMLQNQNNELKLALHTHEKQYIQIVEQMQSEISDLKRRLEEAEDKNKNNRTEQPKEVDVKCDQKAYSCDKVAGSQDQSYKIVLFGRRLTGYVQYEDIYELMQSIGVKKENIPKISFYVYANGTRKFAVITGPEKQYLENAIKHFQDNKKQIIKNRISWIDCYKNIDVDQIKDGNNEPKILLSHRTERTFGERPRYQRFHNKKIAIGRWRNKGNWRHSNNMQSVHIQIQYTIHGRYMGQ